MKGPCKNCNKRQLYCHSNCKEYINWKSHIEEINQKRRSYIKDNYDSFVQHHRNENRIVMYREVK